MSQTSDRSITNDFTHFMASWKGRVARIIFGAAIITTGLATLDGDARLFAAVGIVPIVAGALNLCLPAPIWGGHFLGEKYLAPKPDVEG